LNALQIIDNGETIEFEFTDLCKYHGPKSICGLTIAYKVMQRGFAALSKGEPLHRETIAIRTAFPGPGARDAFELVTRATTRECYTIDKSVEPSEQIAEAAAGTYIFQITSGDDTVELGVKPSAVDPEFIRLRRKQLSGAASAEELKLFRQAQLKLSETLLPMNPEDVVNVLGEGAGYQ